MQHRKHVLSTTRNGWAVEGKEQGAGVGAGITRAAQRRQVCAAASAPPGTRQSSSACAGRPHTCAGGCRRRWLPRSWRTACVCWAGQGAGAGHAVVHPMTGCPVGLRAAAVAAQQAQQAPDRPPLLGRPQPGPLYPALPQLLHQAQLEQGQRRKQQPGQLPVHSHVLAPAATLAEPQQSHAAGPAVVAAPPSQPACAAAWWEGAAPRRLLMPLVARRLGASSHESLASRVELLPVHCRSLGQQRTGRKLGSRPGKVQSGIKTRVSRECHVPKPSRSLPSSSTKG